MAQTVLSSSPFPRHGRGKLERTYSGDARTMEKVQTVKRLPSARHAVPARSMAKSSSESGEIAVSRQCCAFHPGLLQDLEQDLFDEFRALRNSLETFSDGIVGEVRQQVQVLREDLLQATADIKINMQTVSSQGHISEKPFVEDMQAAVNIARIEKLHKDVMQEVRERSKVVLGAVDQVRADGWMATVHADVPQALNDLQSGVQDLSKSMASLSVAKDSGGVGAHPAVDSSELLFALQEHKADIFKMLTSLQESIPKQMEIRKSSAGSPRDIDFTPVIEAIRDNQNTLASTLRRDIDLTPIINAIRDNQDSVRSMLKGLITDAQDCKKELALPESGKLQADLGETGHSESRGTDLTPIMKLLKDNLDLTPFTHLLKDHEAKMATVLQQVASDLQNLVKSCQAQPVNTAKPSEQRLSKAFAALGSDDDDDVTPAIDVKRDYEGDIASILQKHMSDMKVVIAQSCPFDMISETLADSKSQFSTIIADIRHLRTEINLANSSKKQPKECLAMLQTSIQRQPVDCLPGCTNPKLGKHHGKCPNHPDNQEGATVEVHNFTGGLNGRRGKLNNYDFANESWDVNVQGAGMKSIKSENLRLSLQELQKLNIGP